jgi:hypothetical protein
VPLATINAVQPPAWPSWEHLIWVYLPYGPLELSLVLSVLKPPPHSGPASTPDCPKNHLIWVDSIRICPLGFRADFPLELLFGLVHALLYIVHLLYGYIVLFCNDVQSFCSAMIWFYTVWFFLFIHSSNWMFWLLFYYFSYCAFFFLLHLFLSPKEVTISITVSSQ